MSYNNVIMLNCYVCKKYISLEMPVYMAWDHEFCSNTCRKQYCAKKKFTEVVLSNNTSDNTINGNKSLNYLSFLTRNYYLQHIQQWIKLIV